MSNAGSSASAFCDFTTLHHVFLRFSYTQAVTSMMLTVVIDTGWHICSSIEAASQAMPTGVTALHSRGQSIRTHAHRTRAVK